MDVMLILAIVGVVVVAAAVAWYLQRERSMRLRERFGPEYERTRMQVGDARRAEAALAARAKRVEKLSIRPLNDEERARFGEVWRHTQALFVDDPKGAIAEADHLVNEVMTTRGYPMADFNQRAADISVDHPIVVEHYRAARAIADRSREGAASTEDLRQAIIHYRALFDDLLELKAAGVKAAEEKRDYTRR
jgi:hypothetical protein